MKITKTLIDIAHILNAQKAKAILVGGAVRDFVLNKESKDYDVEVFGLESLEELQEMLSQFGSVNLVGKSFGVLKLRVGEDEYDFSLPREEKKVALGHRGFDIKVNSNLNYKEASVRRDFRMNALGYDIVEKKILDPFGGREDIKNGVLRHIDDITFIEDPLRVYRAIQFCARFELKLDSKTFNLCKKIVADGKLDELSKERVYEEFKKLLLKSEKPSIGFELMKEIGILRYFPELEAIIDVPQSPIWHPEGDVWIHTMMALDKMSQLSKKLEPKQRVKFLFAILCHDFGKASATHINDKGKISSIGHEEAGIEPTLSFLSSLTNESALIDSILPLVKYHLQPSIYYKNSAKDSTIRRLATKVNIEDLVLVARADNLGRSTKEALSNKYEAGDWLLRRAKELKVDKEPIKPLLQGRDLIDLGLLPSPKFKEILDNLYQEQLSGAIDTKEKALEYINRVFIN